VAPSDGQLLNTILQTLTAQIEAWYPQLLLYSSQLLSVLILVQFAYIAIDLTASHDASRLLDHMTAAVLRVGIVYILLDNATTWGMALINTGIQLGQNVTGQSPEVLTPSGVYQAGLNMVGTLWQAKAAGGWLHPFQEIEFMGVSILMVLAWAGAAFIYLGTLLEAWWTVYAGPVLICFAALDSTAPMLLEWATRVLAIAIKIAVLLFVLAVGMGLAHGWGKQLAADSGKITTDFWLAVQALVESILFCYLVAKVPGAVTSVVGSAAFAFGESFMTGTASAAGAGASAIGSAAAGGVASAAKKAGEAVGELGAVHRMILFDGNNSSTAGSGSTKGGGGSASTNTGPQP
jgi:P-type conjugative transfer protein TrbL